ncbi:serine/threonine protein kinase [Aquabacterium sp. A7-Y]|uniref:serine/threonine-protein kinase n=1 Tax=Aquabacterium sp. A7-Y TaxID=1349605 RepID=UPI00223E15E5|nr:serine/threonine-protein kinase [Aquabacterium sp. A7-Y]MCW7536918.1 serine/threonine protein kinase [Aquabacterium sp. A7-Y]
MHANDSWHSVQASTHAAQRHRVSQRVEEAPDLSTEQGPAVLSRVVGEDPPSLPGAEAARSGPLDQPLRALHRELTEAGGDSRLGQRVGAYRLGALIGRGGVGLVYRAERVDGRYEPAVAVKLMRDSFPGKPAVSRFRTECQIMSSLDHPNLAKVLDDGVTHDGHPYFVMELVAGEPIDLYAKRRRLTVGQRLQLFRAVCQVVHYAHQKGVVHRDLKPGNILVTHDGTVKLLDFGAAGRIALEDNGLQPVTQTADRMLTLAYASPEQVRGVQVTPASDIYSLGVVLYRLLTGTTPYPAASFRSDYELAKAICEVKPLAPSRAGSLQVDERRRLRGDLDVVLLMALRKDPAKRYASAEQFADDLLHHLQRLPLRARRAAWHLPTAPWFYATEWLRRCADGSL